MTQANRNSLALLGSLDLSFLASALPVLEAGKARPDWIKVTPAGKVNARDGRTFTFDPDALAARFNADKVDVPVDLDHSTVLKASRGETPTTVGYIPEMQGRDDGTYAKVDWNQAGRDTLAAGTHRYVSPSMHLDAANNATWLHSIALTSAPALSMPAIAAALGLGGGDGARGATHLIAVAGALGLTETADEAAILAAIGGMVPKATHEATLAALTETSVKLSALTTSTHKADTERLVDDAIRAMKIVPAQRASYLAMCATGAGVDTFRGLMAATMPIFQPSGLDGKTPPGSDRPSTAAGIIEAATLLQAEKKRLGLAMTMSEAINAVAHRSPT